MIFRIITIFSVVLVLYGCTKGKVQNNAEKVISGQNVSKPATLDLMPFPESLFVKEEQFRLNADFALNINPEADVRLFNAANRFLRRLDGRTGLFFKQGIIVKNNFVQNENAAFQIKVSRTGKVEINEDESYELSVNANRVSLTAATDIGALRGLETLLQLLYADANGYYFQGVQIKDKPRFAWRGLMIDVARHFQPVEVLKRNLDAMAAVKMNVFHFHLSDDQGWRVESKVLPKLHMLASDGEYYTHDQIRDIVRYAADRGIRVMPEIDVPGHATAILTAYPEIGSMPGPYTIERNAGIFDPALNPVNEQTYIFLDKVFTEIAALFPDQYIHIGGDENNGNHWKGNSQIQAFMTKNNIQNTFELQSYFSGRVIKSIRKLNKKVIGWEEILADNLPKDAVVHSWLGRVSLYKAASKGYQTILSDGYYIDLLLNASDHYQNDPLPPLSERTEKEKEYTLTAEQEKLILGGEATMWSELVTPATIDSRIWPRTAAIAERLWSPASVRDEADMYRRMEVTSLRMEELGLTHIKNKEMLLRNLSNGGNPEPLKILLDVIEPYKKYTRNYTGVMYQSYSPFTLLADAANTDASAARKFKSLVNRYRETKSKEDRDEIEKWLIVWRDNHKSFLTLAQKSPVLKQAEKLSENLSSVATIGLEALDKLDATQEWYDSQSAVLAAIKDTSEARKRNKNTFEDGRTELVILDAVQELIDLTNAELAEKRIAAKRREQMELEAATTEH